MARRQSSTKAKPARSKAKDETPFVDSKAKDIVVRPETVAKLAKRHALAKQHLPVRMTAKEAAAYIGFTPVGIYQWIRRGDLPAKKVDGRWKIARSGVLQMELVLEQWEADYQWRHKDPNDMTDEEWYRYMDEIDPP